MSKEPFYSDPDHGTYFTQYDNLEEALEDMGKAEDAANRRLFPEQRAMIGCQDDQYFINIAVNIQKLFIVGEAWSSETANKNELECYAKDEHGNLSDEGEAEFHHSCAMLRSSRRRGYIFGRAFSVIEPRGELGSTHVANMWPISKAAFEEAKNQNWQPDLHDPTKSPHLREALFILYMKYRPRTK